MTPTRVVIACNISLICHGIRAVLEKPEECTIVGEAHSPREILSTIGSTHPDVLVLDIHLSDDSLFETIAPLRDASNDLRILALTMQRDSERVREAAEFGVQGFVSRETTPERLCDAIATLRRGHFYVGCEVAGEIISMIRSMPSEVFQKTDNRYSTLSEREREIFKLLARGHNNKEIAYHLGISHKTVETHHLHIFRKLEIHDPVSLIRYAARLGVINLDC